MDDARLGVVVRATRGRRGWRQQDLASAAGVPRGDVSRIETGRARLVRVGRLRAVFEALGGWVDVVPRLPGADLARTLNAGHAAMHEAVAQLLADVGGWDVAHEVSFSIFGERGIIDVLAWHPVRRVLIVIELKTAIVDANELVGTMDRRRRLATQIGRERGWDPATVATWVVVADTRTNRRRLAEHARLLRSAFPTDGRTMRAWLRAAEGPVAALTFLPIAGISGGTHPNRVVKRVRTRPSRSGAVGQPRIGVPFRG
ncbi:MAG TPA: helix-turn-helix domain-containing protein [Vitreimonas sp.]|nr:helix-turn-helix domain-containing protein [Vitreimonas sp.]